MLRKNGISTSIRSRGSIREQLVKPKDKLPPTEKTGVIYTGACAGANGTSCTGRYVGETARTLSARIDEHFSTALVLDSVSPPSCSTQEKMVTTSEKLISKLSAPRTTGSDEESKRVYTYKLSAHPSTKIRADIHSQPTTTTSRQAASNSPRL